MQCLAVGRLETIQLQDIMIQDLFTACHAHCSGCSRNGLMKSRDRNFFDGELLSLSLKEQAIKDQQTCGQGMIKSKDECSAS